MAFTLKHWLGGVLASCALSTVIFLPTPPDYDQLIEWNTMAPPVSPLRVAEQGVAREIRGLREQLALEQIRAVMVERLREATPSQGPRVYTDERLSQLGRVVQAPISQQWEELGRPAAVRIGIYIRSASRQLGPLDPPAPPSSIRVRTIPPNADQPATCLRVITVPESHGIVDHTTETNATFNALFWGLDMSSCAVYAMFGPPGPTVQEWLTRTRYRFADLTLATEPHVVRAANRFARTSGEPSLYDFSLRALACAAERHAACVPIILGEPDPNLPDWLAFSRVIERSTRERVPAYGWDFAGAEASLVGDLYQAASPEAFHEFWETSAPLEDALATMLDEDPGIWMSRWAQRHTGVVRAGPAPDGAYLGIFGLVTFMAAALGVGINVRRR